MAVRLLCLLQLFFTGTARLLVEQAPLLIDGFTFNNEALAFMRMEYLYEKVDYFLLSESNITFQGGARAWPSEQHPALLAPFMDKIILERVDFTGFTETPWRREEHQRDRVALRALEEWPNRPFILMLSDADEVPTRENCDQLRGKYEDMGSHAIHLNMQLFYYTFEWLALATSPPSSAHLLWTHSYAVSDAHLKAIDHGYKFTSVIRWGQAAETLSGGWHCSSCFGAERIVEKAYSFSHDNYNKPSLEWARYCIANGVDIFNRSEVKFEPTAGQYPDFPVCAGCKSLVIWISLIQPSEKTVLGEASAPVAAIATAAPAVVPVAEPACSAVFIDTGANLGHQIRMLYEPNLYPGNPAESIFGDVFGADAASRQSVCAYGFEPSPVHERRLEALEAAYRKKGYTADELTTVDLASWMSDAAAQATRLVLKANSVENSEPVLDHLLAAGQLCRINAVYGERFSEAWLQKATAALRAAGCKTKIIVLQGRDGARQPAR